MPYCVAIGCKNKSTERRLNYQAPAGISFFKSPKDEELRRKWTVAVRRKDWQPSKWSFLCSAHFNESDIDRTSLSCVRVRPETVPSVFSKTTACSCRKPQKQRIEQVDLAAAHPDQTPVPSTSGVVPAPSASTANLPVPSQPLGKPYVPAQAYGRASTMPYVPVLSELRPTPTPVVAKRPPTTLELNPLPPPPVEEDTSISVKWNTYATNMSSVIPSLLEDEKFVDVTLACDGKYIKCHKVILGACSPYFEELLSANPCQHPIILMKDFQFWEIRTIVDFIYRGVVNIPQDQLPKLLRVANVLQIKGLTGTKDDSESKEDDAKLAEYSREFQPQVGSKRSNLPTMHRSKRSVVPAKKKKTISKSSIRNSFESHPSDESSNQSEASQLTGLTVAASLEPSISLHSVCIKEETHYDVDDTPEYPYGNDDSVDKDSSLQPGQFQLLTLPESKTIKQEVNEDMLDSSDQDPLHLESGVS